MPVDGYEMYRWAQNLFPLNRSLTGEGVKETLRYLGAQCRGLTTKSFHSGTSVGDWTIPPEWRVNEAYIVTPEGRRILDFDTNNLHLVGYSAPFKGTVSRAELNEHLHTLPENPDAIPYVTSYYKRRWGFCMSHREWQALGDGPFEVHIDTEFLEGSMVYGELVIAGTSQEEVLFTTYICHPSLANNELSGPVVATALAKSIQSRGNNFYSYRFLFLPETIGAIAYLSENLMDLRTRVKAGWVITCVGDDRAYSFLSSRMGDTLADRISVQSLSLLGLDYSSYSFLDRGSDERQWCAPGVDLPVASLMRSKYGTYPEYHTSLDNLEVISPAGLEGSLKLYLKCVELMEESLFPVARYLGEPHMSKRGLRADLGSVAPLLNQAKVLMDVLAFCDGSHSPTMIAERIGQEPGTVESALDLLERERLILGEATRSGLSSPTDSFEERRK